MTKKDSGLMNSNRRQFLSRTALGAGVLAVAGAPEASANAPFSGSTSSTAWKFGVMNDTQWTVSDDGYDPATCAVGIIKQIQRQFIAQRVRFVVHVGDLCDNGSLVGEDVRALYAQPLYDAGIGFFPLRGNHDDGAAQGLEFQTLYPQTRNGVHNATPTTQFNTAAGMVGSPDTANLGIPSLPESGSSFQVGVNFSSPDPWFNNNLKGLTYSFDYENARFILLDQFTPLGGSTGLNTPYDSSTTIGKQQPWITSQLQGRYPGSHAFLFAHKGLITCQHADVLFGSNPATNPTLTDAFINAMASNNARYFIHGHDHIYDRSLVSNTTGSAKITQVLASSNSSKFYVPAGALTNAATNGGKSHDEFYNLPAFGIRRRQPMAQQLNSIGFQIVTVDGDNVTVEYYAVVVPIDWTLSINKGATGETQIPAVASYSFTRQESFGYSLNGKQFVVPAGTSYTSVQDDSSRVAAGNPTYARILSGTAVKAGDANATAYVKDVNTGWKPKTSAGTRMRNTLASDILMLWGMGQGVGADKTDTFTLSLSYDTRGGAPVNGAFGIATLDASGRWVNAVDRNTGGIKKFISGPFQDGYGLGTYGVDPSTRTAWAVVNTNGQFAVARDIEDLPGLVR